MRIRVRGIPKDQAWRVTQALQSRPCGRFDRGTLQQDVRRIWRTGWFSDVRARVARTPAGVQLTFVVRPRRRLRRVSLQGGPTRDHRRLRKFYSQHPGQPVDPSQVRQGALAMERLYRKRGHFRVQVTPSITPVGPDAADVRYRIRPGPLVKIGQVSFVGNRAASDRILESIVWRETAGIFHDGSAAAVRARLLSHYYDTGYVNVFLSAPRVTSSRDGRHLNLSFSVREGPRYRFGRIRFADKRLAPLRRLVKSRSGSQFSRARLQSDFQRLKNYFENRGHAFPTVTPVTRVDPNRHLVHLTLAVTPGPRARIRRIRVKGNRQIPSARIRSAMTLKPGDRYSAREVAASHGKILFLPGIKAVGLVIKKTPDPAWIELLVDVLEHPAPWPAKPRLAPK